MIKGVGLLTTLEVRRQAKEFALNILAKPDHEEVTLSAHMIKELMHLMRDYAVITHATDREAEVAAAVEQLIHYIDINESSAQQEYVGYYKTSQLADIFGVSVTAINNWIDEDRFIGFKREPHKHAKIPHFTPFKQRDGRIEPLGHVVERYSQQERGAFALNDEKTMLLGEIEALMQKYGGKIYEEAFDFKTLTPEQESDASRWHFYQMRLNELT